jgi:2,4-dienoyl-CoA reductase-like NADH-dependent reductase (Old Yellow Enzyme family)/thioredoxin reductase
MKYPKLFEKGKIGNVVIKNRIVMTPMGTGFAAASGEASEEITRFYEERAKGGVGLIISEVCRVDELSGIAQPCQLSATDMSVIPSFTRMVDRVHAYGTKMFMQLHHPGNEALEVTLHGNPIIAPSAVVSKVAGGNPKAMTTAEVEAMVKNYVKAAYIAKTAGFDGVEIHAAHGYLVNQFLSPYTNRRTDKYGGDFFNRVRFLTEIVVSIRYACGADFPISVRIDGKEFTDYGMDEAECLHIARYLESIGVAALNVSCGTYESGWSIIEPYTFEEGWKKHLAQNIKACVHIPVIAVNTVKHPAFAEQLLEEGVSDFVGIARGNLCDPEFSNKAKRGDDARVRKCIGCMNCFKMASLGRAIECAVNPVLGRETYRGDDKLVKNGDGRKVAVIGAGPAGLQAAIVLAKRNFKPIIIEKSGCLGGAMNLADKPPCKTLVGEFIETLTLEAQDLGVEIRLNTPGTVELCRELGVCGVIIAAGGNKIVPQVPGIEKAYTYDQVLNKEVELSGKKIAVIGGGLTGLETAEYLSDFNNEVSVIEMAPAVGTAMYRSVTNAVVEHITKNGGHIMTGKLFKEFRDGKVVVNNLSDGFDHELDFDAVVVAMGVKPNYELIGSFEAAFDKVSVVGDTIQPGNIADATHSGYDKAFVF